jgi:hypothetical protein
MKQLGEVKVGGNLERAQNLMVIVRDVVNLWVSGRSSTVCVQRQDELQQAIAAAIRSVREETARECADWLKWYFPNDPVAQDCLRKFGLEE